MRRGGPIGLRERLHRLIQTRFWGMDIDPTARIKPSVLLDRTWPGGVHVGAHTYIAEEAVVLTHDFTRHVRVDTRIGARCHLGARAIVLPGITIGDDCVVRPGALVNRDMPANSVAIGNPAQICARDDAPSAEGGLGT